MEAVWEGASADAQKDAVGPARVPERAVAGVDDLVTLLDCAEAEEHAAI